MHLFRAIDPTGIAIDGAGNAWIANYVDPGRVSEFSSAGVALSPSSGYTGGGGDYGGWSFAIDSSGNVWIPDFVGTDVYEFIGIATPVITPISAGLPATPTANGTSNLGTRPRGPLASIRSFT
ncbi:MAG: hypothetical protein WCF17_21805 [Terracidiphilus sp.]